MRGRTPGSVRAALQAFRLAGRLLPPGFRRDWLGEAEADLERTLRATYATRGAPGVVRDGARALADIVTAIPREWWKAAGPHGGWGDGMTNRMKDLAVAARALLRRPGYATTAVVTLALGIGANVAIFAVVNAVLLRPLPYPDSDALVTIRHAAPGLDLPELLNSEGTIRFYRQEAPYLASVAAYAGGFRNLIGPDGAERIDVVHAEPGLFDVLRTPPFLGRAFTPGDVTEESATALILSHRMWRTRFGGDPHILGTTLRLDGQTVEVVGVMPDGFTFPDDDVDAYAPLWVDPNGPFGAFGTSLVGRLAPGVSVEAARQRTREIQARVPDVFPSLTAEWLERAGWSAELLRFRDRIVGPRVASTLWVILGTVAFVLLIACANVANLFLVRAESRQKELAIRAAMGAGRGRIAAGFLAEALLLGLAGGAVGVALAWGGVGVLVERGPDALPRLHEVGLDGATLAFAAVVSVAASLALGALPLVRYAGGGLAALLRDGGRAATGGRERHRARNVLVASQLALALVLLVGSGLMLRSFQALRAVNPGFDGTGVTTVGLSLGEDVENDEAARVYDRVARQVAALPGVSSVGLTTFLPIAGGSWNGGSFFIESRPRDEGDLPPVAMYKTVGADYLETLRHRLLEGRALTRADWEDGVPVLLVNRAFADQFFDGRPLGERIKWDEDRQFAEIVGVVDDVRESGLQEDAGPVAYIPMRVGDWPYPNLDRMYLLARSEGVPLSIAAVRDIVDRAAPDVPLSSVRTMDEVVAADMAETSFTMVLVGIASGVAVFLGAIGLFGVVSYVVGQRTREIGVRVALGAQRREIRRMVLRQGAGVVAVGVALGLLGAGALSRVMAALLFDVSATDPVSFVAAPVVLVVVAVLATWLPARRAAGVDPIVALRSE